MSFNNAIGISPFEEKVWLARPSVYQNSIDYIYEACTSKWMTTAGTNINEVEREITEMVGCMYAVALSAGTAALHMAVKLAGEALYGKPEAGKGALRNLLVAHLYGTPCKMDEIREVCEHHSAIIIEEAVESLGATYKGVQTGRLGSYNAISFNGNNLTSA